MVTTLWSRLFAYLGPVSLASAVVAQKLNEVQACFYSLGMAALCACAMTVSSWSSFYHFPVFTVSSSTSGRPGAFSTCEHGTRQFVIM